MRCWDSSRQPIILTVTLSKIKYLHRHCFVCVSGLGLVIPMLSKPLASVTPRGEGNLRGLLPRALEGEALVKRH